MRRSLSSVLVAVFATAAAQTPPPPTPPTIDELRSLPYAAPGKPAEGKTGVITNSWFAQPGYNFYGDRFNNRATLLTNGLPGVYHQTQVAAAAMMMNST